MCTVSFIPTASGFRLAMNRDEKRTRVPALPPKVFTYGNRRALYPREPNDGTWLAVNDAGLCLALINWHRIEREPAGEPASRGGIIPGLIGQVDKRGVGREIHRMRLRNVRPFRLIAIDPRRRTVTEWQWDLRNLRACRHRWKIHHWFSSGYDEARAEKVRAGVCAAASLGKRPQLKRLHASHDPRRGPLSICMHRPDAATVSYTEVFISQRRVMLSYRPGPPCQKAGEFRKAIARQF